MHKMWFDLILLISFLKEKSQGELITVTWTWLLCWWMDCISMFCHFLKRKVNIIYRLKSNTFSNALIYDCFGTKEQNIIKKTIHNRIRYLRINMKKMLEQMNELNLLLQLCYVCSFKKNSLIFFIRKKYLFRNGKAQKFQSLIINEGFLTRLLDINKFKIKLIP